jgi:hypothetical protein
VSKNGRLRLAVKRKNGRLRLAVKRTHLWLGA